MRKSIAMFVFAIASWHIASIDLFKLQISDQTAAAQPMTEQDERKVQRLVDSAQRKLDGIERDIDRMESDPARVRSSATERAQGKIEKLREDLAEIPADAEGAAEIGEQLDDFANRLSVLSGSIAETSSAQSGATADDPRQARKIASALSAANRAVETAERAVDDFTNDPDVSGRLADRAQSRMDKARSAIDDLDELSAADAADLNTRYQAIESRLGQRTEQAESSERTAQGQAAEVDDLKASGVLAERLEQVDRIEEITTELGYLQANSYAFNDDARSADLAAQAKSWPSLRDSISAFAAQYGDAIRQSQTDRVAAIKFMKLDTNIDTIDARLDGLKTEIPAALEEHLQQTVALAEDSRARSQFRTFGSRINAPGRTIEGEMIRSRNLKLFHDALPGADDATKARLQVATEAAENEIATIMEKARAEIIAKNDPPGDSYTAADRDTIEQMARDGWQHVHGNVHIASIRIPAGQWTRHVAWRWNPVAEAFQRLDQSTIDVYIFEPAANNISTFWRVEVQKRHLENDALISNPASRERHPPTPDQQVLADRL